MIVPFRTTLDVSYVCVSFVISARCFVNIFVSRKTNFRVCRWKQPFLRCFARDHRGQKLNSVSADTSTESLKFLLQQQKHTIVQQSAHINTQANIVQRRSDLHSRKTTFRNHLKNPCNSPHCQILYQNSYVFVIMKIFLLRILRPNFFSGASSFDLLTYRFDPKIEDMSEFISLRSSHRPSRWSKLHNRRFLETILHK